MTTGLIKFAILNREDMQAILTEHKACPLSG